MIRAFVALRPPDEVCDALEDLQGKSPTDGRPVPWENLHLTLAFLDAQPAGTLEAFHDAFAPPPGPVPVSFAGVDAFGTRRIRLLHAAALATPELVALRDAVRRAARLAGIDLPHERYKPHVSLIRFPGRGVDPALAQDWISARATRTPPGFVARTAILYRSDLTPGAPVYTPLAEYPLAPAHAQDALRGSDPPGFA